MSTSNEDKYGILGKLIPLDHGCVKIEFDNRIEYRDFDGKLHRLDGPAVLYLNNLSGFFIMEIWYKFGSKHRDKGPAVTRFDGSYEYWINDKRHNSHGPAVFNKDTEYWSSKKYEYWLNGTHYKDINSDEEWIIKQILE